MPSNVQGKTNFQKHQQHLAIFGQVIWPWRGTLPQCFHMLAFPLKEVNIYSLARLLRNQKNSVSWFDLFFYVRNDSASYVEDFCILFFSNRQFFLKFSKIYKKSDFEEFFMHISLQGGNRENTTKTTSERYLYGQNTPFNRLENTKFCFSWILLKK